MRISGAIRELERRRERLLGLDLEVIYEELNGRFWGGRLPRVRIRWSTRLRVAGQCVSRRGPIVLGLLYHLHYPRDLRRTLKHEMVHLIHWDHDARFKQEARRVGALIHAREYPGIHWPLRYVYECPSCGFRFRTRKRVALSCARCGDGAWREKYRFRLVKSLR